MKKVLLLSVFFVSSCSSGPRFFINFAEPKDSRSESKAGDPGAQRSIDNNEYWVLYQDWNISHRDLLRDLERGNLSRYTLEETIKMVSRSFQRVQEDLPKELAPEFHEQTNFFLAAYEDLRKEAAGGGSHDIIRVRLETVGGRIRERFHPDIIAAARQEAQPPAPGPPGQTTSAGLPDSSS